MLAWLRSWKGGCTVAVACVVAGVVRVHGAPLDLLTGALFLLAVAYGVAAAVERRLAHVRRAATRAAGPDPGAWSTHPSRLAAWLRSQRGHAPDPGAGRTAPPARGRVAVLTKDRVGAALAIVAGLVGLVLVFRDHADVPDPTPAAPPPIERLHR